MVFRVLLFLIIPLFHSSVQLMTQGKDKAVYDLSHYILLQQNAAADVAIAEESAANAENDGVAAEEEAAKANAEVFAAKATSDEAQGNFGQAAELEAEANQSSGIAGEDAIRAEKDTSLEAADAAVAEAAEDRVAADIEGEEADAAAMAALQFIPFVDVAADVAEGAAEAALVADAVVEGGVIAAEEAEEADLEADKDEALMDGAVQEENAVEKGASAGEVESEAENLQQEAINEEAEAKQDEEGSAILEAKSASEGEEATAESGKAASEEAAAGKKFSDFLFHAGEGLMGFWGACFLAPFVILCSVGFLGEKIADIRKMTPILQNEERWQELSNNLPQNEVARQHFKALFVVLLTTPTFPTLNWMFDAKPLFTWVAECFAWPWALLAVIEAFELFFLYRKKIKLSLLKFVYVNICYKANKITMMMVIVLVFFHPDINSIMSTVRFRALALIALLLLVCWSTISRQQYGAVPRLQWYGSMSSGRELVPANYFNTCGSISSGNELVPANYFWPTSIAKRVLQRLLIKVLKCLLALPQMLSISLVDFLLIVWKLKVVEVCFQTSWGLPGAIKAELGSGAVGQTLWGLCKSSMGFFLKTIWAGVSTFFQNVWSSATFCYIGLFCILLFLGVVSARLRACRKMRRQPVLLLR